MGTLVLVHVTAHSIAGRQTFLEKAGRGKPKRESEKENKQGTRNAANNLELKPCKKKKRRKKKVSKPIQQEAE